MARPRRVPDAVVFEAVLALLHAYGVKAVSFSAVAARAGLAASSLAQRHGTVAGMIRDARLAGWAEALALLDRVADRVPVSEKGAARLLKALGEGPAAVLHDPVDAEVSTAAAAFRARAEAELALRLGGGAEGADGAAILFAAWQGRALWHDAGGRTFRLKTAARLLRA